MPKDRFFFDLSKKDGRMRFDSCFENITIDRNLMKEIEGLGVFCKNQKYYLHEMINRIIYYAKKAFVNAPQKISSLEISDIYSWFMIRNIGKYNDIEYSEFIDDCCIYPKGTIIGSIKTNPFPNIYVPLYDYDLSYTYGGLLEPDHYGAPHYALDFVNRKLNEALPGHNLWVKTEFVYILSIYDLNVLPNMKTY